MGRSGTLIAFGTLSGNFFRFTGDRHLRLTFLFLLLTILAVYAIDTRTASRPREGNLRWPDHVYVRMETRNGPLYYPDEPLR